MHLFCNASPTPSASESSVSASRRPNSVPPAGRKVD
jgi:hypothetical protein